MKFKKGDRIKMKSLDEIDVNDPTLNTGLVEELKNIKGEIIVVREDGGVQTDFGRINCRIVPNTRNIGIHPDHVNLILKKDSHLPEELFEI